MKSQAALALDEQLDRSLTAINLRDRLRFFRWVVLPIWAQGVLVRRPHMLGFCARLDSDKRAVEFMQYLRRKYGEGPLVIRTPWRSYALLLSSDDVRRVLDGAPEPFTPASREKQAALAHFEPHNALITRGPQRRSRRAFHDEILESNRAIHHLRQNFISVVQQEATNLIRSLSGAKLDWSAFSDAWSASVRRIVLGDGARDDRRLTDLLVRLRGNANWVFFRPIDKATRSRYRVRLAAHLERAEPGSLAAMIGQLELEGNQAPVDQVTQWLFAFDAGGITAFRALALLTGPAEQPQRTEEYLRAVFLDTQRLWPTTPVILRETTNATSWGTETLAKDVGVIIFTPFFHRDDERLANAHRLDLDAWLDKDPALASPYIPFSRGPAACPGRHLVTLMGSAWLAMLVKHGCFELLHPQSLSQAAPLPGTLDYFSICFCVTKRSAETTFGG